MRRKWIAALGICLLAATAGAEEAAVLKTEKEKLSYSIGVEVIRNFQRQGIEVELETLIKGIKDGYSGQKLLIGEDELRSTVTVFQNELRRKQMQAMKLAGEENKKAGEAFLTENKKKEGVVTLPSGLQYKILKAGEGKKPTENDMVECHYRGTLINGAEFDSSFRTGKPATFKVAGVIPGWREALKLMPVGSKWQLFIPPQLAYGERAPSREIGPNATLIFEVELLAIK